MKGDIINSDYVGWMNSDEAPEKDIVISSRVRLARNMQNIPFPYYLNLANGEKTITQINEVIQSSSASELSDLDIIMFDQANEMERRILKEKHLISPEHAEKEDAYRGVIVNDDGSVAVMINEEDHIRIQCILPGFQLEKCYKASQTIDDEFEQYLDYAFDENRGYLTACPTNVGTGMRASVMLHLPAISITGQRNRIFQNINQLGMAVRGMYGEGTEIVGNFVQLSNQITLGQTEEEIINNLKLITRQIVEQEKNLRKNLQEEMKYQLEDRIFRAYGILTNARIITSNEAMQLLSDVRLGVDLGLISKISQIAVNQLMVAIKPAHLQKRAGKIMEAFERDVYRATVIKEILGIA